MRSSCRLSQLLFFVSLWFVLAGVASGQEQTEDPLDFLNNLTGLPTGDEDLTPKVELTGKIQLDETGRNGRIFVVAKIKSGWHIYSLTQKPGGPQKTSIKVMAPEELTAGAFVAEQKPVVHEDEFFPGIPIEEHRGTVTFTLPIENLPAVLATAAPVEVQFSCQVCGDVDGVCLGFEETLTLRLAASDESGTPSSASVVIGKYAAENSHVTIEGSVEPQVILAGQQLRLVLTAKLLDGWHVYQVAEKEPGQINEPTRIVLREDSVGQITSLAASAAPTAGEPLFAGDPIPYYYADQVSWTLEVGIPEDTPPGDYDLRGMIGYQVCSERSCETPTAVAFSTSFQVAAEKVAGVLPLAFVAAKYKEVERISQTGASQPFSGPSETERSTGATLDLDNIQGVTDAQSDATSMGLVLLTAFAAGLILNVMPCVLPVIGLKIMSFFQQAGESRGRVFALNLWYTAGVLAVFMVLATLAVVFGVSWGGQFNSAAFNIVLIAVVFVFALSFIGVWEIPLPGFATGGKMDDLSQQEGALGAFFKGMLTTVLATPCSGPLLVPAITWSVSQTPVVTYLGFACVGLGLAAPFLLIGAFPKLIAFLPKPGAWMDTFKHIMGYVLMGTVVLLLTFIPFSHVVPTVAFVIALWAAFWWIGRIPLYEALSKRLTAWGQGTLVVTVAGIYAFHPGYLFSGALQTRGLPGLLCVMEGRLEEFVSYQINELGMDSKANDDSLIHWEPYSEALLRKRISENKTVFIDFTAPS